MDVAGVVWMNTPSRYTWYPATPTLSIDAVHERVSCEDNTFVAASPEGTEGAWVSGGTPVASSTSTQSPSPSLLFAEGVKFRVPLLVSGEPGMAAKVPLLGSYQDAYTGAESFDMSTVMVRTVGMYAMTSAPSG